MYNIISQVKVVGLAAAVPAAIYETADSIYKTATERALFQKITGIHSRRVGERHVCTSDYAYAAAQKLLDELNWESKDIALLIFVTQSSDYIIPATAIILQDRLKLPQSCLAFDINLGCSGYVVGMQVISSMLSQMPGKKALLLVGDAARRGVIDKSNEPPMFGDAATATAFEWSQDASNIYVESKNDGAGFDKIIYEYGGMRKVLSVNNIQFDESGKLGINWGYKMDAHGIFNFSVSTIPEAVKDLLSASQYTHEQIDFYVFHQANKQINEVLRKNLKIEHEKFPYSIHEYGNTSSASIPLTIVTALKERFEKGHEYQLLLCGFGVGLSWGTAILPFKDVYIPELIEV